MKITAVKHFALRTTHRNIFVVKIETDDGLYGVGESGISGREKAVAGAMEHYARLLVGQDPRRIDHLWQLLYRGQYFEGGTILSAAISAVDIALWDIMGKSLGVPVYQLLGGRSRDYVQCYIQAGQLNGPQVVEQAKKLVEEGWQHLRYDPGHMNPSDPPHADATYEPRESIDQSIHWLGEVRRAVGPKIRLIFDIHHRFSVPEAADFCRKAEPFDLVYIEEPIRSENVDAYAALRAMTPMPLAVGEEFSSKWAFRPFIEQGLVNFARIDVCNVGGLTEAKKVASMCEAHYIDVVPHNPLGEVSTAATAHLCTAIPNFFLQEYALAMVDSELFKGMPQLEKDHWLVSDRPGLGIEFNEAAAKDYEFEFWEGTHFFRRDGSLTNW